MTYRKIPILPFLYIPFNGLEAMTEVFPRRAIKLLVEHQVLNEQIAENLLSWWHSGFSIDNSIRIFYALSQESLAQYITRSPITIKKMRCAAFKGKVLFHTPCSNYFKENVHIFDTLDIRPELTPHIPPKLLQLIQHHELHASRTEKHWTKIPPVAERAPGGWKTSHSESIQNEEIDFEHLDHAVDVEVDMRKRAWPASWKIENTVRFNIRNTPGNQGGKRIDHVKGGRRRMVMKIEIIILLPLTTGIFHATVTRTTVIRV